MSGSGQTVALFAAITDEVPVNGGTVTFTVENSSGAVVGLPALSSTLANGVAAASYTVPGGTPVQILPSKRRRAVHLASRLRMPQLVAVIDSRARRVYPAARPATPQPVAAKYR